MNRTIIQVPVDKALKDKATLAATNMGFSSLQENIRVYLKQLADRQIAVSLVQEEPPVKLSAKAEKRYEKMLKDIKSGKEKTYSFDNTDDMMQWLRS